MKETHYIIAVHITDRLKEAVAVQKLLTEFGSQIKTRLGLHEIAKGKTGLNGMLVLEMVPPEKRIKQLMRRLNAIGGVSAKSMSFGHPA